MQDGYSKILGLYAVLSTSNRERVSLAQTIKNKPWDSQQLVQTHVCSSTKHSRWVVESVVRPESMRTHFRSSWRDDLPTYAYKSTSRKVDTQIRAGVLATRGKGWLADNKQMFTICWRKQDKKQLNKLLKLIGKYSDT